MVKEIAIICPYSTKGELYPGQVSDWKEELKRQGKTDVMHIPEPRVKEGEQNSY